MRRSRPVPLWLFATAFVVGLVFSVAGVALDARPWTVFVCSGFVCLAVGCFATGDERDD